MTVYQRGGPRGRESELFMKIIRRAVAFILIAAAVLCICGCSGGGDAASGDIPQLIIGSDEREPYNYISYDGDFVGIDVDIAKEACDRMGYEPVFKRIIWEKRENYLDEGKVDCLWGGFTMTGLEDKYDWAGPYMSSSHAAAVRSDSGICKLSDLQGKSIAVQATSKTENVIISGKNDKITGIAKVYSFSTMDEVYACLRKGYTDAIAGDETSLKAFAMEAPEAYSILPESIYMSEIGAAFKKGENGGLADKLDKILQEMEEDGTISEIVEKYI